jgi:hypothetical protein
MAAEPMPFVRHGHRPTRRQSSAGGAQRAIQMGQGAAGSDAVGAHGEKVAPTILLGQARPQGLDQGRRLEVIDGKDQPDGVTGHVGARLKGLRR